MVGVIIGVSDETMGYRIFLQKDNKVVTTHHVTYIETLNEDQNNQQQLGLALKTTRRPQ